MLSAAASLGMILLWDVDGGLTQIDKYLYSSEDYIKVGDLPFTLSVNCSQQSSHIKITRQTLFKSIGSFFTLRLLVHISPY